jgi:hypothetical protein
LALEERGFGEDLAETSSVYWTAAPVFISSTCHLSAQNATDWLGEYGGPRIRASLRDPTQNARNHVASVEVEVENIWLNYPNEYMESGVRVGVLQYRIDHCPAILTTETRLRFEKLKRGKHAVTIRLLGSNNELLVAPIATLRFRIP